MRKWMCLVAAATFAMPAFAQPPLQRDDLLVRYGVKIGTQTLDSFNSADGFHSDNNRFAIGFMAELRWNDYFAGEIDVMYRQFRFDALIPGPTLASTSVSVNRAHTLDFPLLVKYKPLGFRGIAPFVDTGISLRYINANERRRFFEGEDREAQFSDSFAQDSSFNAGWVVGAGLDFNDVPNVRLTPEVRYTIWFRDNFRSNATIPGSPDTFTQTNDQFEILLGITF